MPTRPFSMSSTMERKKKIVKWKRLDVFNRINDHYFNFYCTNWATSAIVNYSYCFLLAVKKKKKDGFLNGFFGMEFHLSWVDLNGSQLRREVMLGKIYRCSESQELHSRELSRREGLNFAQTWDQKLWPCNQNRSLNLRDKFRKLKKIIFFIFINRLQIEKEEFTFLKKWLTMRKFLFLPNHQCSFFFHTIWANLDTTLKFRIILRHTGSSH